MPSPPPQIRDQKPQIAPSLRSLFNAFLEHGGDLEAVARHLATDPWTVAEAASRPEFERHLSAIRALNGFTAHHQAALAIPATVARLRELQRVNNEFVACNACCALVKLARAAPPRNPKADQPLGRILQVHDPLSPPLDASRLYASMPSPPTSVLPTSSAPSPRKTGTPNPSPPSLDPSCLDAPMPSSLSLKSEILNSPPSVLPTTPNPSPPSLDASCLDGSMSSPPTFGLSADQLAQYSSRERKRLISVPLPEGGYTTFDPKRPFAGFNGDPIDFLRFSQPPLPFLPGESEHDFYPYIRATPDYPVDFPLPSLYDTEPFPDLDPEWFPPPVPGVTLPSNLKDVSDLTLDNDTSLTIARSKNPWLCLPLNGRAKPDRKRITADPNGPYAFRKIVRALFNARNLARSAWQERWQRAELCRLIALKRAGSLPLPNDL